MQSNPFNKSRISTVVVAVIMSNIALADAPGNVRMERSDCGLTKASVVDVSQIVTLDRTELTERVRAVAATTLNKVDDGLRLVLAL